MFAQTKINGIFITITKFIYFLLKTKIEKICFLMIKIVVFSVFFQGGNSVPRNSFQGSAPPHLKGPQQRPSTTAAMTSPAAISNATYRSGTWQTQGYPPSQQQAYRYSAPLAQPAYAYTQHTASTTVSFVCDF